MTKGKEEKSNAEQKGAATAKEEPSREFTETRCGTDVTGTSLIAKKTL